MAIDPDTERANFEASEESGRLDKEMLSAAHEGNWKKAKRIIDNIPVTEQWTFIKVASMGWAVVRGHWEFFEEMLKIIRGPEILTTLYEGNTILHLVGAHGKIKQAKALLAKCPSVIHTKNTEGEIPLFSAVAYTNDKDMVWYLTLVTVEAGHSYDDLTPNLIFCMMAAGYYDIIHFLLQRDNSFQHQKKRDKSIKDIILSDENANQNKPMLRYLASRPSEFRSGARLGWLECCIYPFVPVEVDHFEPPTHVQQEVRSLSSSSSNHRSRMQISMQSITSAFRWHKFRSLLWSVMEKLVPGGQMIRETKFKHECVVKLIKIAFEDWHSRISNITEILEEAASSGTIEILEIFFSNYMNQFEANIGVNSLAIATIKHRQDKVFNFLFYNWVGFGTFILSSRNRYRDRVGDEVRKENILHMAAALTHCPKVSSIAGAAFQMQRELQWFKGIEKLVHPLFKEVPKDGNTPWEFFKNQHQDMRKEGEKWMRNTSNSCMLVVTLIATVVFAAAFTVPGGNNQDNGTPIFLQKNAFMLFAGFDVLALFFSINSLWMFLSILTASFTEEDFLSRLPKRLIYGLACLFVAVVSTITAFCAALSLVLGHREEEVIVLLVLMAFVSVAIFALLQLPLFVSMVRSTYGPRLLVPK